MEAFKKGQFPSLRAAASSYDVPEATLLSPTKRPHYTTGICTYTAEIESH